MTRRTGSSRRAISPIHHEIAFAMSQSEDRDGEVEQHTPEEAKQQLEDAIADQIATNAALAEAVEACRDANADIKSGALANLDRVAQYSTEELKRMAAVPEYSIDVSPADVDGDAWDAISTFYDQQDSNDRPFRP